MYIFPYYALLMFFSFLIPQFLYMKCNSASELDIYGKEIFISKNLPDLFEILICPLIGSKHKKVTYLRPAVGRSK